MLKIVSSPIDTAGVLAQVQDPHCGASVLFLGTTRELTGAQRTTTLYYECYQAMALSALQELAERARAQWEIAHVAIVHRIGEVPIGEASVAIAVSAPHRAAAFAAGQWLIDTLKASVPIWKCEHFADGTQVWQHPENASLDVK